MHSFTVLSSLGEALERNSITPTASLTMKTACVFSLLLATLSQAAAIKAVPQDANVCFVQQIRGKCLI